MTGAAFEADWTWTGRCFEPGVVIRIGDDGRFAQVGGPPTADVTRLHDRALLPGFVNAHSHAFQRALRGAGERFVTGAGDFWSWRTAMYELVESIDRVAFVDTAVAAFREMLRAGITTVGEFHYLHHSPGATDFAFDELALEAARRAGIRLVLIEVYYRTGGIGQPLSPAQRRFETRSPDVYWAQMDRLAGRLDPSTQSLGAAVHSVRAAELDEIAVLHAEAAARGLPFHIHLEEQRGEIEESRSAYGRAPMAAVLDSLSAPGELVGVHCTHTTTEDMQRFLDAGGRVCVCPITEANLGDGIPGASALSRAARGGVSLGTDSNVRVDMTEEMRWLEYGQRLRSESRGMLTDGEHRTAPALLEVATAGGGGALGIAAGRIAPGAAADLVAIDLQAPGLDGWSEDTLLAGFLFGAGIEAIAEVCVGGRWQPTERGGTARPGADG